MTNRDVTAQDVMDVVNPEFTDRCLHMASIIVGKFVEKWAPTFTETIGDATKAEKYVRGAVGLALLSVGTSQLHLCGMDRETAHQEMDDAWNDWEPRSDSVPTDAKGTDE